MQALAAVWLGLGVRLKMGNSVVAIGGVVQMMAIEIEGRGGHVVLRWLFLEIVNRRNGDRSNAVGRNEKRVKGVCLGCGEVEEGMVI